MGCGETNIQAIHRLQPAYSAYRTELAYTVQRLPPPGALRAYFIPAGMSPPVVFNERDANDPRATAEIVQLEELQGQSPLLTLSLRSPVHFCLDWTGPKNPLSPDVWDDRGHLGEECAAALGRPWLVVLRTVELRLPERLRMEVFVIDMRTRMLAAALPVDVFGRYAELDLGNGPWAEEASRQARSAFHEAASCELGAQLSRLPGASVAFDGRGCEGRFTGVAVPASRVPRAAAPDE
jgi:hypothetical protein